MRVGSSYSNHRNPFAGVGIICQNHGVFDVSTFIAVETERSACLSENTSVCPSCSRCSRVAGLAARLISVFRSHIKGDGMFKVLLIKGGSSLLVLQLSGASCDPLVDSLVHLNEPHGSPGLRVNLFCVKHETRPNLLLLTVSWRMQNVLQEVKRSNDSDLHYEALQSDS